MRTRFDAQNYVITCIEANGTADRAEYDVDAIVNDVYKFAGSYDFEELHGVIDHGVFWDIVQRHER